MRSRPPQQARVLVVGGGLAGAAAAAVLCERGVPVTLLEREAWLGGRLGAWPDRHEDGTPFEMERGFHAFFRHYHNLRGLLARVDPGLSMLAPLEDYPIVAPGGLRLSFRGVPRRTPHNLIALLRRSHVFSWRDLARVNVRAALEMLTFDLEGTRATLDRISARDYLDSLRFPPDARRLFFDVFAHSFFNPEEEMSAAELLTMFHFYLLGNPEGLVFDVLREPFSTSVWRPLRRYLEGWGARVVLGAEVRRVSRGPDGWRAHVAGGGEHEGEALVLALAVPALQELVASSPDLGEESWRTRVQALRATRPFAVWRLWLDRPMRPGRAPFVGTTGFGALHNVSLFHAIEGESARWAARSGGSVVELHAYAVPPGTHEAALRAELLRGLHAICPETAPARIVAERWLLRADCPAFPPGQSGARPGVETPHPDVLLAGDFVRLPFPSALMERAVTSGVMAANRILLRRGLAPEPVRAAPARGWLASARDALARLGAGGLPW